MKDEPIRIILVDDHEGIRKSVRTFLEMHSHFDVIADCENGDCAISKAEQLVPDIMLVDINMSPMNGFDVTERVLERVPSVKIIALTINNQPKYATQILGLGAKGYITKTSPPKEIAQGILDVHNGGVYICHEVKNNMHLSEQ
jgi:two-component system, NarL family, invasion response regulator UvrY